MTPQVYIKTTNKTQRSTNSRMYIGLPPPSPLPLPGATTNKENMLKIMLNYQAHKMPVDDNLHMTPLLHPPPTPTPPPPPLGLNPSTNISYKTTSTC